MEHNLFLEKNINNKDFSKLKVSPSDSVKATTPFGELTTFELGCLMNKRISPSTTRKVTKI